MSGYVTTRPLPTPPPPTRLVRLRSASVHLLLVGQCGDGSFLPSPLLRPARTPATHPSSSRVAHGVSRAGSVFRGMAGSFGVSQAGVWLPDAPLRPYNPADFFFCFFVFLFPFLPLLWLPQSRPLQDDTTASDWIALGYESKTKIVVKAKGDTGYDGLMEICDDNAVLFCLLRLIDGPFHPTHLVDPTPPHTHTPLLSPSISHSGDISPPVVLCPGDFRFDAVTSLVVGPFLKPPPSLSLSSRRPRCLRSSPSR